jgi:hypothetical protein
VTPKWIKRRFGLHARPVSVRTRMPWYLRGLAFGFVALSVGSLVWIAYPHGRSPEAGSREPEPRTEAALTDNVALERTNAGLRSELAVLERQLQMERATYVDLARQVKELTHENARLREEIALVQAISAADSRIEGVKVSSVRVEPNSVPGEYNYRIVLMQTGSRNKQFTGRYQLIVNLMQNGERRGMTLPAPGDAVESPYQLDFRVHQRIDGTFRVDPAAVVRSVELRVFEGRQSQPKVMQTVTLS